MRDQRTLLILLFVPAFFLLLYGYALNFDIRNVSLAVKDQDRSATSRELVSAFVNSGYFSLVGYVDSDRQIERLVDEGRVRVILTVPANFERDLMQGIPTDVQVIIDGDNANTASTVLGYSRTLIAEFNSAQMTELGAPGSRYLCGAAYLVQPAAAQHAVPGPGPHRLHLDDHRRRLHGAVGGAREGTRHHGAGADGPNQPAAIHHRQDHPLSRDFVRVR